MTSVCVTSPRPWISNGCGFQRLWIRAVSIRSAERMPTTLAAEVSENSQAVSGEWRKLWQNYSAWTPDQ